MNRKLSILAGLFILMMGSASVSAQTNGYHDVGDCSTIAGWAWDASQPTTPISVDIYSDNTLISSVSASTFRQDLQNAGIGDGNHGFQISTPAAVIDGQPHTLTVKYGGTQTNLNNTPKTVSCIAPGQPTPSYEGYLDVADCTHIALWAWDRNQPTTPITVDLYDGATLIATVSANAFRQDLLNAGKGNGIHSADITLPAGLINGQGHTITAKYGGTQINLNASPKTLSCIAPGQPTPSYEGYLDVADCTHIAGWGWDQNQASTPISIDLYDGATLIATVSASAFRQDLLNAGKGNGSHSFDIPVPSNLINGQGHTITAKYSGTQTSLNASPRTLSCVAPGQPTPSYNGYHDGADCTGVTGWAWDANQPTGTVSVDVYDGASKIATVAANQFRQDLVAAGIGDGLHGFQLATPNSVKDGASHVITLRYAGTQQTLNTTPKSLTCAQVGARLYYLFPDHLGTPRLVTDEQSNVVWRNLPTTEPFGNSPVEDDPNATGNHFEFNLRFPGQYADRETNLNQNFFRDYNPATGGYVQSDPIGRQGGGNTYTYAGGNPISSFDPLGLYPAVQVTLPNGTSYIPMTTVKNSAQAAAYGLPIGRATAIAVPPGTSPQGDVACWATASDKGLAAFKKYWADPAHNYKVVYGAMYDAYGNFAYGATGEAAGYPLWLLQGVAQYLHNWNNNPINSNDIMSGFNAIATGGTLNVIDYNPPAAGSH